MCLFATCGGCVTAMHWNALLPGILKVPTTISDEPRAHKETPASLRVPGGGGIFPFRNCPRRDFPLPNLPPPPPLAPLYVLFVFFTKHGRRSSVAGFA